jgi:preprotein translocase subunit SecD
MVIIILFAVAVWVLSPSGSDSLGRGREDLGMRLGLDLTGGTHILYEADLREVQTNPEDAMAGAIRIIRDRVDAFGVTEPAIQKHGNDRIIVELPGMTIDEARDLIGQVAQLDFREQATDGSWVIAEAVGSDGEMHALTGEFLKPNAQVQLGGPFGNEPAVAIEFDSEGAKLFEEITYRNWHKPLGIYIDGRQISAPEVLPGEPVQQGIKGGKAVITGPNLEDSRKLAIQLNSGALPVPLGRFIDDAREVFEAGEPMYWGDVSATLGEEFVDRSVLAGVIGLALVMLFMMLYYRLPGVLASLSLLIYGALVLAIFKLIPVTLTLAGIAGFVLSVGMAVDANVLIFERFKEELRGGRTLGAAVDTGFNRAWVAIRDSNISTFIICGILYWFGSSIVESAPVTAFAATLFIGVAVSMFTAIVITRTFLRFFKGGWSQKRLTWFGVEPRSSEGLLR